MIRLGLRLTLGGGKESVVRLIVTALAVALGVGLLLMTLAGMNTLGAQAARSSWLNTTPSGPTVEQGNGRNGPPPSVSGSVNATAGPHASTTDPLWWLTSTDQFGGQTINRVDVAATGPHSPVPPGIAHLPGPGQFYASPTLSALLRATPASELGERFGGRQVGTIGPSALESPDSLDIVIGHSVHQLSEVPGAGLVTRIQNRTAGNALVNLEAILAVAALALLFPLLIFIGTATRLSAARREQRFAAMRLVGGSPRQVAVISAVEASIAALGGMVLGFCLFYLMRPALLHVPFTGVPFGPGDLSLKLGDILVVAIGVPAAAAVAARVALRRVMISPLGVTRRVTPPVPRAHRVVPLLAGVGILAYFVAVGHPKTTGSQEQAYLGGTFLIMAGLIIGGPWLTMAGSRIMARRTSNPAMLIAGRRLSDNPRGAFRSISGLILALFVTSVTVGVITTIVAGHGPASGGTTASATLIDQLGNPSSNLETPSVPSVPNAALHDVRSIPGVRGVTLIHVASATTQTDGSVPDINGVAGDPQKNLVSCAQLATTPALGRCAPGAKVAAVVTDLGFVPVTKGTSTTTRTVWPTADISLEQLSRLPVQTMAVATTGSVSVIARVQTALDVAFPFSGTPTTFGQLDPQNAATLTEFERMMDVVILASLIIAGCSLAVTMAAGLSDRKRPFSLLRLTGVPLTVIRRVVAFESALPLVVIALFSAGMGLLAAELFLRSELGVTLRPPGLVYYVIVLGGLLASLGIITSTLPLLDRITRPETARIE